MKLITSIDVPDTVDPNTEFVGHVSYLTNTCKGPERIEQDVEFKCIDNALDAVEINNLDMPKDKVVIFKFPKDMHPLNVQCVSDYLKVTFTDCTVIGLLDDIETMIEEPDDAIDLLEKMIAHIKIKAGTSKKIII